MSVLPRLRLALARRPWLYWLFIGMLAATVWLGVAAEQSRLAAQRAQWGATQQVWVADMATAAGRPVVASSRLYPLAMVPASAIASAPADALADHSIAAGEVLVAGDLAGDGPIPDDWLVFSVPGDSAPMLSSGDHVAVFGSGQQWCEGIVVQVANGQFEAGRVEIGVPVDCAPAMSAQLALGAVTLARTA